MQLPALLKILVVFVLVVAASMRRVHLGLAAAAGGIGLALWSGMPLADIVRYTVGELVNLDLGLLAILLAGIMGFSAAMKKAGALDAFAAAVGGMVPSRPLAMAVTPLLIGTLPMPGGAILSAPLVDSMNRNPDVDGSVLSAVNYWFRHCLELFWPLYPAFILTSSLTGMPPQRLMLLNFYALPVLFGLGMLFILPTLGRQQGVVDTATPQSLSNAAHKVEASPKGLLPLAIVLGVYVVGDFIWHAISPGLSITAGAKALVSRYVPIYLGLLSGALYVWRTAGTSAVFHRAIDRGTVRLILVVVGIRVFSALIGAGGLATQAARELSSAGIPPLLVIAALPCIAGLVTGVGFGYVGLAYPIVLGIMPSVRGLPLEAGIVLAGAFGFTGMMLSPLHVCMVVSAEHFHTPLAATIRRFILPLGLFLAVAMAYAALLAFLL